MGMGKREKQKAKLDHEEENEDESKSQNSVVFIFSDDDEEANEDLSLKIVEKALLMRAAKFTAQDDAVFDVSDDGAGVVDLTSSPSPGVEDVAGPSGASGNAIVSSETGQLKSKKKIKERIKKIGKIEIGDQTVTVSTEVEKMETGEAADVRETADPNAVEISDNIILRKLLRGPRYFDPPGSSWGTCYNCGEEGHMAVNCTAAKRKKPCFVCGSLDHGAKQCSKGQDCFICKKAGHRAKDCPDKEKGGLRSSKICLECGDFGHDMFSCRNNYSPDDLKEIQCYVCKSFGHLCCVDAIDIVPREVSCYKCGELGHTGLACTRLRVDTTGGGSLCSCYKCGEEGHFARECPSSAKACTSLRGETTGGCYKCGEGGHFARECPSSAKACTSLRGETTGGCYKCGEGGHFARECPSSAKACTSLRGETTGGCYKCGEGGHFARECPSSAKFGKRNRELSTSSIRFPKGKNHLGFKSAPHDVAKAYKRKKTQYEERDNTTPRKSKHRGGWITEDPGDFYPMKSKRSSWRSPVTPTNKGHKISTVTAGGHISSSPSSKKSRRLHLGSSSASQGSAQGSARNFQHRYSASRFGDSTSDVRRSYNWW